MCLGKKKMKKIQSHFFFDENKINDEIKSR